MNTRTTGAPFTRAVVNAMKRLYPEDLADKTWDNTGLLLQAPFNPLKRQRNSVLLTIDLTRAVADEAIGRKDSIVVAYHPIIFKGLKSLSLADSQQESLLRLAAEGISVYCPHTAVDAAANGLGDWLADIVTADAPLPEPRQSSLKPENGKNRQSDASPFRLSHQASYAGAGMKNVEFKNIPHTRKPIKPLPAPIPGHETGGMGRVVTFNGPQRLSDVLARIHHAFAHQPSRQSSASPASTQAASSGFSFPLAIPQGTSIDSHSSISTVGVCAGSGGSLFSGLAEAPDLLLTGEMSHHEVLAATERGQCVVSLFHSNSERGYLHARMKSMLEEAVGGEWEKMRQRNGSGEVDEAAGAGREGAEVTRGLREAFADGSVGVGVSRCDRDPYGICFVG